jgi:hypothetical protein
VPSVIDLKKGHDRDQREEKPVFAQVAREVPQERGVAHASCAFRLRGGRIGHLCSHSVTMSDMMRSCAGVFRVEFADEGALVHDIDAVAEAQKLGHLGRNQHHALIMPRQLVDDGVDLELRTQRRCLASVHRG